MKGIYEAARQQKAFAEGALTELRNQHTAGLHNSFNRMMDTFERFHGDANAATESRAEQNTLLEQLKASSKSLSTSAEAASDARAEQRTLLKRLEASSTSLSTSVEAASYARAEQRTLLERLEASSTGLSTYTDFAADSRAEQKTLLEEFKASSSSLFTSAGGIQASADVLKTTSDQLKTLKSAVTELGTSSTALQNLQGLVQNNVGDLSKSIGGMQELSAGIKASSDILAKQQETILANDEEARESIVAMDRARSQMQAVREAYLPVKESYRAKRDVYNMLIEDFDADRYDLEEKKREFQEEEADIRAELRRAAADLADERDVHNAMADSLAHESPRPSPKKRRRFEEILVSSPKRPRFEQPQETDEDSQFAMAGETLIEITSSPTGQDDSLPRSVLETELAPRRSSNPDHQLVFRDAPSIDAINPENPPAAVEAPAQQPPQDVVDRIFELFVTPADWTQAKQDEFIAYLRSRYDGQTFDDVKDTLNRAATDTPRTVSARKCLVLHGEKGVRSCVSKNHDFSLRANCPAHGATANGLCLIINKVTDGVQQWSLTDRL